MGRVRDFKSVKSAKSAKSPHYWKLKAAMAERHIIEAEASTRVQAATAKVRAVMAEAGLDPDQQYTMNDATETIDVVAKPTA